MTQEQDGEKDKEREAGKVEEQGQKRIIARGRRRLGNDWGG